MLKRTVYTTNPFHISCRLKQLILTPKEDGKETTMPVEDLGFVILDHPSTTITLAALQELQANNTAVIVCDAKHLPAGLLLPLEGHYLHSERLATQIQASEPLKKQLWQYTIKYKIRNQAKLLENLGYPFEAVKRHADEVKSGDTSGEEAKASRHYWKNLFPNIEFRRDPDGAWPNAALNYGYAILRAAVARALVGNGLLPALGIFHHNRYNAYPLADDMMEPYRPFIDGCVIEIVNDMKDTTELNKEIKARLINTLSSDVKMLGETSPMLVAIERTAASLSKSYEESTRQLLYPEMN